MCRRNPNSKNWGLPDVSLSAVARETLPFPVVRYAKHYGTFFAFSEQELGLAALCDCRRGAIGNILPVIQMSTESKNTNARRGTSLEA